MPKKKLRTVCIKKVGKGGIFKRGSITSVKDKFGYLQLVTNSKGKKPAVQIYQGVGRPGFSVRYTKSGKNLPFTGRTELTLVSRLVRRGHKKITFLD